MQGGNADWEKSIEEIFTKRQNARMLNRGAIDSTIKKSLMENVGKTLDMQVMRATDSGIQKVWKNAKIGSKIDGLIDDQLMTDKVLDVEDKVFDSIEDGKSEATAKVFQEKLQKLAPKIVKEMNQELQGVIRSSSVAVMKGVQAEMGKKSRGCKATGRFHRE